MKNLLLAIMLIVCSTTFSQANLIESYNEVYRDDLVKISVAKGVFKDDSRNLSHSRYFIQYENLTNKKIEVRIQKELYYGERCFGCNDNKENYKTVIVAANTSLSFDENNNDKRFYFFEKDNNGLIKSVLTDFTIKIVKTVKL